MKTKFSVLRRVVCLVFVCLSLGSQAIRAQMRVGQPSGTPDGSATLDVSGGPYTSGSPYRGFLPPKVALTQTSVAAPVTSPATGLLIYNTAKAGDVTPGYYYWEGNKWLRLSTATTGASRTAAVGDPIPAYTYSEARALTNAPGALFMLKEPGQEGLFRNANTPTSSRDTASANGLRDASGNIISSGTIMMAGGQRYKRVINDGIINIKWFGAAGQGDGTDDAPAIQKAVNYAKSITNIYSTLNDFATVLIPPGHYRIRKTIDVTKSFGLLIRGSGSRYNNAGIVGNTGGIMFDFTGSTQSGCENLFFQSYANEGNPSTVGVQFALNSNQPIGGLNCTVRNCYIMMADMPSANNGIGTIGILNCRAEEFGVTDCFIQANIGCIFSNKNDLSDAGLAYTVSSLYAPVATSQNGSMGVINFSGQNSILNQGKAQPALILNGTNSVNFQGFIARASLTGSGTNEAAILCSGSVNYNISINGTIESFAQLMRIKSPLLNSTINGVVANQTNNATSFPAGTTRHPVIDLSGGGQLQGCKVNVSFGNNSAEMGGRYLLYDSGQQPAGTITNSDIICPQWSNTSYVVSSALLINTSNTSFKIAQPFEKKPPTTNAIINSQNFSTAGWTVGNYNQIVPTGILSTTTLYIMKVIWGKNGVDQIVQSYIFPISGTDYNGNPAAQVLPTLTPTTISWGNLGRTINIRYKGPTVTGQTSYGLEASINQADMSNGTLTITVSPLL